MANPTKVLFVDDEPTIRLTLPKILEMHEFDVTAAATVKDALRLIQQEKFDVLLSDLNIGAPSDGFTVVSAMRRVQPEAVTIIITGYPAFESALQAIREQVDDYIAKPADINDLVLTIQKKLTKRDRHVLEPKMRIAALITSNLGIIMDRYVARFRKSVIPRKKALTDDDVKNNLPDVLKQLVRDLESFEGVTAASKAAARVHGRRRREQHFHRDVLIDEIRLLRAVIFHTIQQNILSVDVSYLLADMIRVSENLDVLLKAALDAFADESESESETKIA
jgi:YesN/AraC family two-component response regulator